MIWIVKDGVIIMLSRRVAGRKRLIMKVVVEIVGSVRSRWRMWKLFRPSVRVRT
jgi:hypothetical protein